LPGIGAGFPGDLDQVLQLAAEADLLAEHGRAALDAQRGLGDRPALARTADHVFAGVRAVVAGAERAADCVERGPL
jgi:hypothetical protein